MSNFTGFSTETVNFLKNLAINNTRSWFNENRAEYEKYYMDSAANFVEILGSKLKKIAPDVIYQPKLHRSILRLNRDARFSKGQVPYKTRMGLVFWCGRYAEKAKNPAFYFHLEPDELYLSTGLWLFDKEQLALFRSAILNNRKFLELKDISEYLDENGIILKSYKSLTRCAKGFKPDMPQAAFSKFLGMHCCQSEMPLPDIVYRKELIDYCMAFYSKSVKLLNWMTKNL